MHNDVGNHHTLKQPGLVISYFGNSVAVEADDGQVFQCHLHRNQELPVVGDRVEWQLEQGNTGTIIAIIPRRSVLQRGDGHNKKKLIAANIDVIAIVMAPPPIFSEMLVDRYLMAAELLAIQPVIVINKMDLLTEAALQTLNERLEPYTQVPYPVILSSVYKENGLQALSQFLHKKSAVLVGPSGVGKSSIIAALSQQEAIRVAETSAKGAGKHTTTATRLYHLPEGGSLIDSPGVREFNLWPITKQEVWRGFKELHPFSQGCKFRDCQHIAEPSCSVITAVNEGKISKQRYTSYQTMLQQAAREGFPPTRG